MDSEPFSDVDRSIDYQNISIDTSKDDKETDKNETNNEDKSREDVEINFETNDEENTPMDTCLLYTSPSPRDVEESRMPSSA